MQTTIELDKPKRTTKSSMRFGAGGKEPLTERLVLIPRSIMPGHMRRLPKKRLVEESKMMVVKIGCYK